MGAIKSELEHVLLLERESILLLLLLLLLSRVDNLFAVIHIVFICECY